MTPYWADNPCPPWCDNDHPASREHLSTDWSCQVVLTTETPSERWDERTEYVVHTPRALEVYVAQHFREIGSRVVISQLPTGEPKHSLLPDEAAHLGIALLRLAAIALGDREPRECAACAQMPCGLPGMMARPD